MSTYLLLQMLKQAEMCSAVSKTSQPELTHKAAATAAECCGSCSVCKPVGSAVHSIHLLLQTLKQAEKFSAVSKTANLSWTIYIQPQQPSAVGCSVRKPVGSVVDSVHLLLQILKQAEKFSAVWQDGKPELANVHIVTATECCSSCFV